MPGVLNALQRLACGEEGQDLVEYAFLTMFVALATIGVFLTFQTTIGSAFGAGTTAVDGLWVPPEPGAGS